MRVAVMGSAGSSVGKAPFQDARYLAWVEGKLPDVQRAHDHVDGDWQIWACSPGCWAVIPRATRFFEVHRWETGVVWFSPEYQNFLRRFTGPVYTGGKVPEIPNHVVYPIDRLEEKFSSYFMTSSLALMLALAIDTIEHIRGNRARKKEGLPLLAPEVGQGPIDPAEYDKDDSDDVIGMWGVDMAAEEEYAYQRPGCQFFMLEALRRGIGVYLPPESDVMRPMPVYGISEWDHNYIKLTTRARELNAASQQIQQTLESSKVRIAGLQGEQHALNAFVNTWTTPYGMQAGIINRQTPGTGLGGGITHLDARPISRMLIGGSPAEEATVAVMDAAAMAHAGAEEEALDLLEAQHLSVNPVQAVKHLIAEAETARLQSSILQPEVRPGEGTPEALRRILGALNHAVRPIKVKSKRKR